MTKPAVAAPGQLFRTYHCTPGIQARHAECAVGVGPRDLHSPNGLRCALWRHFINIGAASYGPHTAKVIFHVTVGKLIDTAPKKAIEVGRQNLVRSKRCRLRVLVDLKDRNRRVQARWSCRSPRK